jgi:hypothetical protein
MNTRGSSETSAYFYNATQCRGLEHDIYLVEVIISFCANLKTKTYKFFYFQMIWNRLKLI